jgi:hypothetical protein
LGGVEIWITQKTEHEKNLNRMDGFWQGRSGMNIRRRS